MDILTNNSEIEILLHYPCVHDAHNYVVFHHVRGRSECTIQVVCRYLSCNLSMLVHPSQELYWKTKPGALQVTKEDEERSRPLKDSWWLE